MEVSMNNGWHKISEEVPEKDKMVLCQGAKGAMFIGFFLRTYDDDSGLARFYVPNRSGRGRNAVAWHELPEPFNE